LDFCLHFEKFIFQIFYLDFFVSDFYSFLKEICLFLCLDFEKKLTSARIIFSTSFFRFQDLFMYISYSNKKFG